MADAAQAMAAGVTALWERSRDEILARVDTIGAAGTALAASTLTAEDRQAAERDAHKLAGVAGTFGFEEATPLAHEAEALLEGEDEIPAEGAERLSAIAVELRAILNGPRPDAEAPKELNRPTLAVFDGDETFVTRLGTDARAAGIKVIVESTTAGAEELIGRQRVDAVLVDLAFDGDGLTLLRAVQASHPNIVRIACSDDGELAKRVEAASAGARFFLQKPVASVEIVDLLRDSAPTFRTERATVFALDTDPGVLALVEEHLTPLGADVTGSSDPAQLWASLADTSPDLLVVGDDVPDVSSADLCRALRGDPRQAGMPIVFLTKAADASLTNELLAAGADVVLSKPVDAAQLVARVASCLRATRFANRGSATDPLTGAVTRRRAIAAIQRMLAGAAPDKRPVSVAIVSVDRLEDVSAQHGHLVADESLERAGRRLRAACGVRGVVGQWSEKEFLIAFDDAAEDVAVQRLADVLDAAREETLPSPSGDGVRVTLSGGVAAFPDDGTDWHALTESAAAANEEASKMGGGQVRTIRQRRTARAAGGVDVVVVDDDAVLASAVEQALHTRGYSVRVIPDGLAATAALAGIAAPVRARVILLDLGLPGQDGFDVLRKLQISGVMATTRVVVLTARSEQTEVVHAARLGAFDYIVKPFSVPELIKRVRRAVEISEGAA